MIPEDRRLVVEVPETVRSGPAILILVTSSAGPIGAEELPESARIEARNRWQASRAELARDSRPSASSLPRSGVTGCADYKESAAVSSRPARNSHGARPKRSRRGSLPTEAVYVSDASPVMLTLRDTYAL
jgi:hypothetical protein